VNDLQTDLQSALTGQPFDFEALALRLFRFQSAHNPVYKNWLAALGCDPAKVLTTKAIPFLPISLFKTQEIRSINSPSSIIFTSSGTTARTASRHILSDQSWYKTALLQGFQRVYGPATDYVFLALLPGYLERSGSSLIFMVNELIRESSDPLSGYFLHADDKLLNAVEQCHQQKKKVFLWGVTFALLDCANKGLFRLQPNDIVLETGGMKGRGPEMIREALHEQLKVAFGVPHIHSEYGMTELLSQAYAVAHGRFISPPWMQILIRDSNDPYAYVAPGKSGGINVIDLANYESCAFIQTDDLGKMNTDGSFEVLGRFDHSELRGCNLLLA